VTRRLGLFLIAVIAISTAACSGDSGSMSPTGPSGANGAQIAGRVSGVSMSSTAPVSGLSATGLSASPLTQASSSSGSLKVSVNGTSIATNVDGTGHFMLDGVPSGTIVLNFSGRGVDASVTLRGVNAGDKIDIDVRLDGGGARVDSDRRQGKDATGGATGADRNGSDNKGTDGGTGGDGKDRR